ncbi:hypothetical protein M885DRAFT_617683 [Pelagophyceae sp. CCMP2097]|nr:hypothetical protein M885DRAFT_617683 [Pelagophyceae sp. CCMP2097]
MSSVASSSDGEGQGAGQDTADDDAVSKVLAKVMGFVDPLAHALATRAAPGGEAKLATKLATVMSHAEAAACAKAIISGAADDWGQSSSSSSSSGDDDAAPLPSPWGEAGCADEEMEAFSKWISPDANEQAAADDTVKRIADVVTDACCPKGVDAAVEVYGSRRMGTDLFDSDVDVRVVEPRNVRLKDVAKALDEADWTTGLEHVAARVAVVKGRSRHHGLAFDVSRAADGARASIDMTEMLAPFARQYPKAFVPISRFCKVLLRQRGLEDVYSGGLGSFRLCVMIAAFLDRNAAARTRTRVLGPRRPLGTLSIGEHVLLRFLEHYAYTFRYDSTICVGALSADLATLDDPRVIQTIFASAAQAIRDYKPLSAILDVRGLAKKRKKSKARAAAYASRDEAPARPPKRARTDT